MNQEIYQAGIKHLISVEANFEKFVPNHKFNFFLRPKGFEGICSLVIEQQISVAAAESIKERVFKLMSSINSNEFLKIDTHTLNSLGLSRPKINYLQGIAEKEVAKELNFEELKVMTDSDARDFLCQFKGIGSWTADCYLMACLGRQDIWPIGDIGLREGVKRLKNLKVRPDQDQMIKLAHDWSPYRSVAANLLWNDYDD